MKRQVFTKRLRIEQFYSLFNISIVLLVEFMLWESYVPFFIAKGHGYLKTALYFFVRTKLTDLV